MIEQGMKDRIGQGIEGSEKGEGDQLICIFGFF